jgi:hypothetical protein
MRESLFHGTIKAYEASPEKQTRDEASCRLANGTASYCTTNRGTVQSVILVTGATSNIGRHVASQLLCPCVAGRALIRNPDSAVVYLSSEGADDDLEQQADTITARIAAKLAA